MPEVIIKYKNARALKALQDVAKAFDMIIEKPAQEIADKHLPIRFAKKPDANALSGIWKDNRGPSKKFGKRHGAIDYELCDL